jgi:hypothetical protein
MFVKLRDEAVGCMEVLYRDEIARNLDCVRIISNLNSKYEKVIFKALRNDELGGHYLQV